MAESTVIYVHGAGGQKPAGSLKLDFDMAIFGKDVGTASRVAYFANVRWPKGGGRAGATASQRAAREKAVRDAARPDVSPADAAKAIVDSRGLAVGGDRRTGQAGQPGRLGEDDRKAAQELVATLYRRADAIGRRSSASRVGNSGPWFPDSIFRIVVGRFAIDVVDYLFGEYADRMRDPVRRAFGQVRGPCVVIAHSLGSIVAYDVLSEAGPAAQPVPMLVTAGCPLGLGNVQPVLRDRAGIPNPVPAVVQAWTNFADRWDPVALDASLGDSFTPEGFVKDDAVNNRARNNHDMVGYVSVEVVRQTIRSAVQAS